MKKSLFATATLLVMSISSHAQNNANRFLSNLKAPTAVNVSLLPATSGTLDLGSDALRWKTGYFGTVDVYSNASIGVTVYTPGNTSTAISGISGDGGVYGHGDVSYGVWGTGGTYGVIGNNAEFGVRADGSNAGVWATGNSYGVSATGGGYGVRAIGSGNNSIGVSGEASGFGIYGTTSSSTGYAGYFDGRVGASSYQTTSDQRLKQNIREFTSAMEIINKLKPMQYEFRKEGKYKLLNLPQGSHFGLLAQDVEKILPDLVSDTKLEKATAQLPTKDLASKPTTMNEAKSEIIEFKTLNYTELIPILIKAMQEQQQQIDELKQLVAKLSSSSTQASLLNTGIASLRQNAPNPFSKNAVIQCYVPASSSQAQLVIYNTAGQQLKAYTLGNSGMNEVTIDAGTLVAGHYVYSLFVDGKKVDSRSMVVAK